MFTLRDLDELAGFAVMNIRTLNSTVLRAIGEKVRVLRKGGKFDKFESQSRFSSDADKLLREIQKEIDIATASIEEVYARVAKIAYRSYAESFLAQGLKQPPIEQERALVNFIQSVAATTKGSFANLSNTTAIGFKLLDPGGRTTFVGFKRHYHNLVDQAVADISTGNESWSGALRNALKQTADSGIRVLDYESGYSRRLDSAMRQNVLDGVKAITTEITARNGEKFGADGWEIDAHNWCAPDHLPFQGRRFTKAEFEEIQEALPRKFETWNCRHTVYAVDLRASTPLYTEEELQKIAGTSTEAREFDGREYTAYEATQLQRKLETQIRKHKDRANIAKAAGDDLTRRAEQLRINQLKDKYVELSNRFGLPVAKDRMAVAGFRRVKAIENPKIVESENVLKQVEGDSNEKIRKLQPNEIVLTDKVNQQYVGDLGDLQQNYYGKDEPGRVYVKNLPVHYNNYSAAHMTSSQTHLDRLPWIEINIADFVRAIESPEFIEINLRKLDVGNYSLSNIVKVGNSLNKKGFEYMKVAISLSKGDSNYHQITTIHPVRWNSLFDVNGDLKAKYKRIQ